MLKKICIIKKPLNKVIKLKSLNWLFELVKDDVAEYGKKVNFYFAYDYLNIDDIDNDGTPSILVYKNLTKREQLKLCDFAKDKLFFYIDIFNNNLDYIFYESFKIIQLYLTVSSDLDKGVSNSNNLLKNACLKFKNKEYYNASNLYKRALINLGYLFDTGTISKPNGNLAEDIYIIYLIIESHIINPIDYGVLYKNFLEGQTNDNISSDRLFAYAYAKYFNYLSPRDIAEQIKKLEHYTGIVCERKMPLSMYYEVIIDKLYHMPDAYKNRYIDCLVLLSACYLETSKNRFVFDGKKEYYFNLAKMIVYTKNRPLYNILNMRGAVFRVYNLVRKNRILEQMTVEFPWIYLRYEDEYFYEKDKYELFSKNKYEDYIEDYIKGLGESRTVKNILYLAEVLDNDWYSCLKMFVNDIKSFVDLKPKVFRKRLNYFTHTFKDYKKILLEELCVNDNSMNYHNLDNYMISSNNISNPYRGFLSRMYSYSDKETDLVELYSKEPQEYDYLFIHYLIKNDIYNSDLINSLDYFSLLKLEKNYNLIDLLVRELKEDNLSKVELEKEVISKVLLL